jgi:cysteinyl-tRNA synthetase
MSSSQISNSPPLYLYNTIAREKQIFVPIKPGCIGLYVCGPTVYDFCHIGNARPMVVFDVVQRWLRALGYQVTYVRNITDIDDKIIKRAVANNESCKSLTERFTQAMHEDVAALGVQPPDHEPKATQYLPQMIKLVERLESKGLAYRAPDKDVNFRVNALAGYGKLSGKSLEDLRAGERISVNTGKDHPLDFVLWKSAKEDEPAEVKWSSPFGAGRPGWHLECSAMSSTLLGDQIDIHGGGQDLQFPHHENEIAQSEGAMNGASNHGPRFVNYWMHNGFVQIDDEKMSKSLGNFFTIRDVLKLYHPEVIRFFFLRAQYRSPLNYSDKHLDEAKSALMRLYTALARVPENLLAAEVPAAPTSNERFALAMNDDFNTPMAIAVLFDLAAEINRSEPSLAAPIAAELLALAQPLGLLQRNPAQVVQSGLNATDSFAEQTMSDEAIEALIKERAAAKIAKNFSGADAVRKQLQEAGITLEDSAAGTRWRRS